jgi:hypothetical protein
MNPKQTALVLIEYQNDFTTEGGTLHQSVKGVMEGTNMHPQWVMSTATQMDCGAHTLQSLKKREFDSPILRARRARKIGLLGEWRVAPLSQKPDRQIHVKKRQPSPYKHLYNPCLYLKLPGRARGEM